jgi:predicted ester cyclase
VTEHKALVRRLVDEVMNGNNLDILDDVCSTQLAPKLRSAFTQFRDAFPDWHQELIELVAEDSTVVARFRCTGTHQGA